MLYHWFSPEYLFDFANDGDNGKLISTNSSEMVRYGCTTSSTTNAFGNTTTITPGQKIVNGLTLNITESIKPVLVHQYPIFKNANFQNNFNENDDGVNIVSSKQYKLLYPNAGINQTSVDVSSTFLYRTNGLGVFLKSFIQEHFKGTTKLCENTSERQFEIFSCNRTPYYVSTITAVGSKSQIINPVICNGQKVQINATGLMVLPNTEYKWFKDDKLMAGETKSEIIASESGTYTCNYKTLGSCDEQKNFTFIVSTSCDNSKPIEILANTLHSNFNRPSGFLGDWFNWLDLVASYYIRASDFHKMPKSVEAAIYNKQNSQVIQKVNLNQVAIGNRFVFFEKACGIGFDTVFQVSFTKTVTLNKNQYPSENIDYEVITSPICCRASSDNLEGNTEVITHAEFGGANIIPLDGRGQMGYLLEVVGPRKIDACIDKTINISFIVFNKSNVAAKLASLTEVIEPGSPYKNVSFKSGFSANKFAGIDQNIELLQDGNSFLLKGVPKKTGTFTYKAKFDGLMNGKIISSVYCEFQLTIRDCSPPPKPFLVGNNSNITSINLCPDSSVMLNVRNFPKNSTFQWKYDGNKIISETDSILVLRNKDSGKYSCTVIDKLFCPESQETQQIQINFLPSPTVSITASNSTGSLCQGGSVKITGTANPSNSSFQWQKGFQNINGATKAEFDASESGQYRVKIISPEGCINYSPYQSIITNSPPKAEITASKKVICKDSSIVLEANKDTGQSYEWYKDGVSMNIFSSSINTNKTGNYTVKVTGANTCSTNSNPFVVIQKERPIVSISNPKGTKLCQGASIDLAVSGNNLTSYQWQKNGININTETKQKLAVSEAGDYTVSVIDSNGCVNTSTVEKISIVNKINVSLDSIPLQCGTNNLPIQLKGTPQGGVLTGKGIVGSEFFTNLAGVGNHKITYTVNGALSCLNGSDEIEIVVSAIPKAKILNPNDGKICEGEKVKILTEVQDGTAFQWYKDNLAVNGAVQKDYETDISGTYHLVAKNQNNCLSQSEDFLVKTFPKPTLILDSIPNLCGSEHPPITLNYSPKEGFLEGKGIIGNVFDPKIAGVGEHQINLILKGDPSCLNDEISRKAVISPLPNLDLGPDKIIFNGQSVKLNGELGVGYNYGWSPIIDLNNPLIGSPEANPKSTTIYKLIATGPNSCFASDSIKIEVIQNLYIPNIFTPNDDRINENLEIMNLHHYPHAEVLIFDRWGNIIFQTVDYHNHKFDGFFNRKKLPMGDYNFIIRNISPKFTKNGSFYISY